MINLVGERLLVDWSRALQEAIMSHDDYKVVGMSLSEWERSDQGDRAKAYPEVRIALSVRFR